ncbi:MAG: Ribosomal RNA-processing protein 7 [Trizodia sp. TS-e1964]|nr:MAG: Ribosomal RNA-processing protein 7 [Trizodia sp. TS-e1964]
MSDPEDSTNIIHEYSVLALKLSALKCFSQPATHYIYVRRQKSKNPKPTDPRALFLVNVPFDATEKRLKHLFSTQLGVGAGRVESVTLEDGQRTSKALAPDIQVFPTPPSVKPASKKRRRQDVERSESDSNSAAITSLPQVWDRELHNSGSCATILFVDKSSTDIALKRINRLQSKKNGESVAWDESAGQEEPLGSARYLKHHYLSYPAVDVLQTSIDKFMTQFAAAEVARADMLKRQRNEPDEDGFVKVTRGGRVPPPRLVNDEEKKRLEKEKGKDKLLKDFYRFQMREERKAKADEMVRKFDEDRKRIREMKQRRERLRPL